MEGFVVVVIERNQVVATCGQGVDMLCDGRKVQGNCKENSEGKEEVKEVGSGAKARGKTLLKSEFSAATTAQYNSGIYYYIFLYFSLAAPQ